MAISYVNASSDTSTSGTTHTGTAPASIQDNDILVGAVLVDSATDTCTWPAGWAEWAQNALEATPASRIRVGWKRCASESGNYQWTNLPDGYKYTVITAFRGCKTAGDPANVSCSNTTYRTNDKVVRAAQVTTTIAGCALIWAGAIQQNATLTKPTDFTKADDEVDAGYYSLLQGYLLDVAAGATGAKDGASSANTTKKHAFLIALEPASSLFVPRVIVI